MEEEKKEDTFNAEDLKCPICGAHMHLVKGRFGTFYACNNFKVNGCKGTLKDPKRTQWKKENGAKEKK